LIILFRSKRSKKTNPCEEIVYWAGIREGNKATVRLVIAPDAKTDPGRVVVSQEANFHFVKSLSSRKFVQLAQVHTHPSLWVSHSWGDSIYAPFKINGLLSIVVPNYCKKGMLPLEKKCGVHRFEEEQFIRLSEKIVKERFHILNDMDSEKEDLRKWCSR
jgi:hypothetical protein